MNGKVSSKISYGTINLLSNENKVLAESETIRFTDAYLQKHWQEHVLANATLIYGEKIPTYMGVNPILK